MATIELDREQLLASFGDLVQRLTDEQDGAIVELRDPEPDGTSVADAMADVRNTADPDHPADVALATSTSELSRSTVAGS